MSSHQIGKKQVHLSLGIIYTNLSASLDDIPDDFVFEITKTWQNILLAYNLLSADSLHVFDRRFIANNIATLKSLKKIMVESVPPEKRSEAFLAAIEEINFLISAEILISSN